MRTISNREFSARPDIYFDMAREQAVRVRKGREIFHIVHVPSTDEQPLLAPDDDFRRAIPMKEFKEKVLVMVDKLDKKYARK
jgi:hypothetical protein